MANFRSQIPMNELNILVRVLFFATSLALAIGCSKNNATSTTSPTFSRFDLVKTGISGKIDFDEYPPKLDTNAPFTIKFWKTSTGSADKGPYIDPGFTLNNKTLDLFMPGHLHGWYEIQVTKRSDDPNHADTSVSFRADNVFFFMPGDWQVRLTFARDSGEVVDSVLIPYLQK
jgi:hypothetical protein